MASGSEEGSGMMRALAQKVMVGGVKVTVPSMWTWL
jgi:hypothetical protein